MATDVMPVPGRVRHGPDVFTGTGIAAIGGAGALYAAGLAHAALSPFYGNAVSGMAHSWRAFFVGSLDHQAILTIDKQPGFLWPQAVSARLFGFHPWALVLPQVIEGIVCIAALFTLVRGVFGSRSAALAAITFALTPIAASTFGHVSEDGLLTMAVVVAAAFWHRALRSGRWLDLAGCAVFVAVGFQAKMLAAWFVLVPFVVAWVLFAAGSRRRRWTQVGGLVGAAVVGSLSWALVVSGLQTGGHPFVDGTTNGNPFTMIFGYNGLARFGSFPGSLPVPDAPAMAGVDRSPVKLVSPDLYSQYGWFLPLALAGALLLLSQARQASARAESHSRRDERVAAVAMWTIWLAVPFLIFTFTTLPHTSYVLALAPPVAALAGAGLPALVDTYRAGARRWWLLPVSVLVSGAAALGVLAAFLHFSTALAGVAAGLSLAGGAVLLTRRGPGGRRGAVAVGLAGVVLAAAVWSASVIDVRYAGTASDPAAGPAGLGVHARPAAPPPDSVLAGLMQRRRALLAYVTEHSASSTHARFALVSNAWPMLSPYILADPSVDVLALGGFSGAAPAVPVEQFRRWVEQGRISFFLIDRTALTQPALAGAEATKIARLVERTCTRARPLSASGGPLIDPARLLYRCGSAP